MAAVPVKAAPELINAALLNYTWADSHAKGLANAGGPWDEGWQVESKMRTSGTTAGTWDSEHLIVTCHTSTC